MNLKRIRSLTLDAKQKDKSFQANKSAEISFQRALKKVARAAGNLVESHIDGTTIHNEAELVRALHAYSNALTPWARKQSAKLLHAIGKKNQRATNQKTTKLNNALRKELVESDVGRVAASLMEEQVALIKSIPVQAGRRAQALAAEALVNGARADEVAEELMRTTDVTESRAILIARTETARSNASLTQARASGLGAIKYIWRTTLDGAERTSHKEMNGKEVYYLRPPTLSDGTKGHAGTFPNCLPGDSKINGTPFIEKIYRHFYAGQIVRMKLASGRILCATPNHPVFTRNGLLAVNDLNIGQELVCKLGNGHSGIDDDVQCFNPEIEKLFNSLSVLPGSCHSSVTGGEFHGDRTDQEVDIVSMDRGLMFEFGIRCLEEFSKLNFSESDVHIAMIFLKGNSSFDELSYASFGSSNGIMSRLDLVFSNLSAHFGPLELFGLALVSDFYISSKQSFSNCQSTNVKKLSDHVFAYSILVHGYDFIYIELKRRLIAGEFTPDRSIYAATAQDFADQVRIDSDHGRDLNKGSPIAYEFDSLVDKSFIEFSGHIYNLQTASGFYISEGVFNKNCRCYQEPIFTE